MIAGARIGFDPALPWSAMIALCVIGAIALGIYVWRGGGAPVSRGLGLAFLFLGLMQPQWVRETREPADDVALIVVDQSESLALSGRREAARAAGDAMAQRLSQEQGLDVRVRETRGGPDGTIVTGVIEDALSDVARDRIGGVIVITDGQAADPPDEPGRLRELGPAHVLIVGDPERGDRRLELISAPTFGIVGEPMRVTGRVIDASGNAPVAVTVSIDGQRAVSTTVRANTEFSVDLRLAHRGRNMVIVEAAEGPQEITLSNNRAAFAANGVRDRLRVLLITGEPHAGARVWRNLLKSDPAVDLVHFSILRPPDKQDFTPLHELALIPFPTEELFERRLDEFDLIIFDRAPQRGILQAYYFSSIARRIEEGGALLITAGDQEAGPDGLYRTALAGILPSQPTGQIISRPYRPTPTTLGRRHPVVRGLPAPERWGRWTREIDARATGGQTVLSGADGRPLLVLDRAGRGRVAQLWSDQPWLWARGYDGGGPHGELLRRLAHWLMQEPELEDDSLTLDPGPRGLEIERSTLANAPGPVEIISPSGQGSEAGLDETAPGLYHGAVPATEQGLYEARSGDLRAFAAVGPLNPREAGALGANPEILRPLANATGGSVFMTGEEGRRLPEIRRIERGARAQGGDWIGIEHNGAYTVRAAVASPLGPGWLWALFALALLIWGWRRESV
ncbi:hypothetical protein [Candidatus Viadribacter manganicus]|uniref:Glutamine amidotransferase domain-containing protein n=1 Tax=Candidatus Viadribacter manganicus TaxID=1759059 RepID=A0A1B1AG99_9PROT|nr:hypothetical protein [Candidatus Viadribacter manganicus]ANP45589.1 hypothetical protein ATE48_06485 [Candidatus Viadribacter manganicus]